MRIKIREIFNSYILGFYIKKKLIKFTKFNILIKEYNCDYKKYNCNKSILERVIL